MSNRATAPSVAATTIALRFVADLQSGKRPSIEAALDSIPTSEWPTLLHSLLIAEVNSRMARGEVPLLREYLPRFPTHAAIVRSVLPDVPVAQLAPIIEPLEPEAPSIPVARVLVPIAQGAAASIPLAIALPRAFEDLEPPQESEPGPQRRQRRKLPWVLAGAGVVVLVIVSLVVLKYTSKPRKEPMPPGPETTGPVASSTTTKPGPKVEPKAPAVEGERGLAEWVQKLGGNGILAMDAGGRRPFNPETPLPKAAFAVAAITLPPDMPPRWNASDLTALRGREKLTSIQLNHPTALTDVAFEPLIGLPLQALDLRGANIQITGAMLANFPALTSLTLLSAPNFSDADLKEVAKLKKLASLAINSPKLTAEGLKELKPLPLRSLLFGDNVPLGADQVREFQGLPLEEFESSGGMNDDAFLELAVVQTLKRIRVRKAKLTDAGMKTVAGLGKLEELQISGATLTGAGLEHLNERKGLKVLDLSGSNLNNEALEKLLALTGLKELRLAGAQITDQGANLLAQLEGLEILDLGETSVGDTTLGILKKHATLKSLILTGTKVTSPAVNDFESATPQCKVIIGRRK